MLSLILLAYDVALAEQSPRASLREQVVRSLGSLVEGVVNGIIADATLVGPEGVGLAEIADEAGCALIARASPAQGLAEAVRQSRREEVFVLAAGYAVERGFFDEARDALAFGGLSRPRTLRLAPSTLLTRLAPNFAQAAGLLARKSALEKAGAADVPTLARRLRGLDLVARARSCA